MPQSAQDCITSLLDFHAPQRLLLIGEPAFAPDTGSEVQRVAARAATVELATLGRFDFAVVSGLVEQLDPAESEAVLGRLKNLHTDRFLLLVDPGRSHLGHDALLALALAPFARLDDGCVAWRYDIDRYNPEREWNNPEDWANPENFDRFRW